jgi:hypothetical protein
LPITDFYKAKNLRGGCLNKCKECAKIDAHVYYKQKSQDADWVEKERERGREKYSRLNYKEKYKNQSLISFLPSCYRNIERKARQMGLRKKGYELHHWNYNKLNSVFLVSAKAHKCIHRHMTFDRKSLRCYKEDGTLLKTKKQAEEYFNSILLSEGFTEKVEYVEIPYKTLAS